MSEGSKDEQADPVPPFAGYLALVLGAAACVVVVGLSMLAFVDVPPDDGTDASAAANRRLLLPIVWVIAVALGLKGLGWASAAREVDRKLAWIGGGLALVGVVAPVLIALGLLLPR